MLPYACEKHILLKAQQRTFLKREKQPIWTAFLLYTRVSTSNDSIPV